MERINTLFSLFQRVKKEVDDVVQLRNLTNFHRHVQYFSFPPVNPVKSQPPGMPATCRYFCSQQFAQLAESNCSRRLPEQTYLGRLLQGLITTRQRRLWVVNRR